MIRAWYRLIFFAVTMVLHFSRYLLMAPFTKEKTALALRIRQRWIRFVMPRIGVKLVVSGTPPTAPGILVGNHLSYIDPVGVLHDTLAWPVAKAEVSKWPLIGKLAKETGILFVERGSKDSRADTAQAISDAVNRGLIILNYPEGTTQPEPKTLQFRRGAFRIAAKHGFTIYPSAVWYDRKEVAWVGDDTFLPHFLRTFGQKHLTMYISYGPVMRGDDAEELLIQSQAWIDGELLRLAALGGEL